jgi:hypothetical protein
MHKFGHIVVVIFEIGQLKQVLNIPQITRDEVIHGNNMEILLNKPIAQMRTEKPGTSGNQYPLSIH